MAAGDLRGTVKTASGDGITARTLTWDGGGNAPQSGDKLFCYAVTGHGSGANTPIGWTKRLEFGFPDADDIATLFEREAGASETGVTVTIPGTNELNLIGFVVEGTLTYDDENITAAESDSSSIETGNVNISPAADTFFIGMGATSSGGVAGSMHSTDANSFSLAAQVQAANKLAIAATRKVTGASGNYSTRFSWSPYDAGYTNRGAIAAYAISSGGSPTLLTVQDAQHGHAADAPSLTQASTLAVQDGQHGHSAESVALSQQHVLSVAEALHGFASDTPVLTVAHVLTVQEAQHAHTADGVALTQQHALAVADSSHAIASDNLALDLGLVVDVADALHANSVDALSLVQANVLVVSSAQHNHAAETVSLLQSYVLAPQDAQHGHGAENLTLDQSQFLVVQEALHALQADAPELLQDGVLVVSDALHAHLADNITFPGTVFQSGRVMVVQAFDRVMIVAPFDRIVIAES